VSSEYSLKQLATVIFTNCSALDNYIHQTYQMYTSTYLRLFYFAI